MEKDPSDFDEQLHRGKLKDFRLGLDDQLSLLERGLIERDSKQALFTYMVAEVYEPYEDLVTQTVMGTMMDAKARQLNKHFCLKIRALELKLAEVEGQLKEKSKQSDIFFELLFERKSDQLQKGKTSS